MHRTKYCREKNEKRFKVGSVGTIVFFIFLLFKLWVISISLTLWISFHFYFSLTFSLIQGLTIYSRLTCNSLFRSGWSHLPEICPPASWVLGLNILVFNMTNIQWTYQKIDFLYLSACRVNRESSLEEVLSVVMNMQYTSC